MGSVNYKATIIMGLLARVPYADNTQSEGETDLDETYFVKNCTLIVCSKTKIDEWIECLQEKVQTDMLNVCIYYGRNREKSLERYLLIIHPFNVLDSNFLFLNF